MGHIWIGKAKAWDLGWLYLPGLLAIILSWLIPESDRSTLSIIFAFVALGLLDSGHVYATLWRTYLHNKEFQRSRIYLYAPPFFFSLFFLWSFFSWPLLGAFVVYATLFHNFKQLYGVNAWFQRLNAFSQKNDRRDFYFLTLMPVFLAHFREDFPQIAYYSSQDFLWLPNPNIYKMGLIFYFAILCVWIFHQWRREKLFSYQRILSFLYPAFLYSTCFLLGKNLSQVLFPLVVSHGLAYIGILSIALPKISGFSHRRGLVVLVSTAIIFGSLEFFLEDEFWNRSNPYFALSSALLLTPLFCHYLFDSLIWKRSHPEAAQIYGGLPDRS